MAAEKELLEGISLMKQGKEEGFNILYSYTYNFVYARARAATKNETDAQDLTQETFIQAYKGIASLEDANNVYAWLGGIVFRQGAKLYNKTKKELLLNEDQDYIFDEVETKDLDALPEASAELKATSDVVMSMIEELPELQRSAIVSFYYDHMKIEEIAKVFDCSVNTIKSRLNYAKKFLKSKVEEHQKTYSYKLFSFSPAILLLALRELLASEKYTMAPEAAEKVYHVACETLGITASSIALGATAAATSSSAVAGATGVATGATGAAGTAATTTATTAKGAGLFGKFMALSAAKKTGAVILATTLVGGGATTGVLLTKQPPAPPAIVVETEQEIPDITATPGITEAPKATEAPSITEMPSVTPVLPDENHVYSSEEYYSYLAQQAKAGVEQTRVYCYNMNSSIDNVPKLQQYAGINVSMKAVLSDSETTDYTCMHGHTHSIPFVPIDITFTYGDTEIAAYSKEDYWDKLEKAVAKRLGSFTIYTTGNSIDEIDRIWQKYISYEYPTTDFLPGAVCYLTEIDIVGGFPQYYQGIVTYHFAYLDSNDIRINHVADIHYTISEWYEGDRTPGVTFYIPVSDSRYNNPTYFVNESTHLQSWFDTQYPDSGYHMEFGEFTGSEEWAPLYFTCTIKKDGDPDLPPEPLPPVDETISLAPIATPQPTPTPVPKVVLTDEETLAYANQILAEIITPNMSDLEKVKAIHDYMIMHLDPDEFATRFDMVLPEHTTVNSALGSGYAPCDAYAATFHRLCTLAGLEVISVSGHATHCWNHIWNQVKVDGNWYNIDVCADENLTSLTKDFNDHSNASYGYFLVSDADLGYTAEPDTSICHPCTTESIAFHALDYGCPWGFYAYCSSYEELKQLAQQASAKCLTHMRLFPDPEWQFSLYENLAYIYEGISQNHYATEITYNRNIERYMNGQSYDSYDIWFLSENGVPVTYPYADTTEEVHQIVTQGISERKRTILLYAPNLDFVKSALGSYTLPKGYFTLEVNNHYDTNLRNLNNLIMILAQPAEHYTFPHQ